MKKGTHYKGVLFTGMMLMGGALACGLPFGNGEGGPGEETSVGDAYLGLAQEAVTFTSTEGTWTYLLETQRAAGDPSLQYELTMEGLPASIDLGDVSLIVSEDSGYMTGPAVGEGGCAIFPLSEEVLSAFPNADDLLPPAEFSAGLVRDGSETVAGVDGTRYTYSAANAGDLTDVSGEIVLAKAGDYVLRYTLTGQTSEPPFGGSTAGTLSWAYQIDAFGEETLAVPAACAVAYPLMPDAANLVRLPGLIIYQTAKAPPAVLAYYVSALEGDGWAVYEFPQEGNDRGLLTYAKEGVVLTVSAKPEGSGAEVSLFFDEE
jgi:hypothetical protein